MTAQLIFDVAVVAPLELVDHRTTIYTQSEPSALAAAARLLERARIEQVTAAAHVAGTPASYAVRHFHPNDVPGTGEWSCWHDGKFSTRATLDGWPGSTDEGGDHA